MKSKKTDKKSDRVPLNEAVRLNQRAFGIWWRSYPMIFVSTAVSSVAGSLSPYVGIYLSARILNEIAGRRDPEALTGLVITALIAALVLTLTNACLDRWKNCKHAVIISN